MNKLATSTDRNAECLRDLLRRGALPSEIEEKRLRRDFKEAMKVDAGAAHMALGVLDALTWNEEDMREHFRVAADLGESLSAVYFLNLAASLKCITKVEESAKVMADASEKWPNDTDVLRVAAGKHLVSGQFSAALMYLQRLAVITPETAEADMAMVENVVSILRQTGATEDEAATLFRLAFAVAAKHKLTTNVVNYRVDLDPSDPFVVLTIKVHVGAEKAVALECELDDLMAETWPETRHSSAIFVCFSPMSAAA